MREEGRERERNKMKTEKFFHFASSMWFVCTLGSVRMKLFIMISFTAYRLCCMWQTQNIPPTNAGLTLLFTQVKVHDFSNDNKKVKKPSDKPILNKKKTDIFLKK